MAICNKKRQITPVIYDVLRAQCHHSKQVISSRLNTPIDAVAIKIMGKGFCPVPMHKDDERVIG